MESAGGRLPEVLTLTEAAHFLRCSPRHARDLASEGAFISFRLTPNGPRLVRRDDLREYVDRLIREQNAKLPIRLPVDEVREA